MESMLWVEKYRPHKVADTILPAGLKSLFQNIVDKRQVPNLLLSGGAGQGKTTVAKAVLDELESDYVIINGSLEGRSIDTLRTDIMNYASSKSITSFGRKFVILDEADHLPPHTVQAALRNFMEDYSDTCGFILTANYRSKIIEPLQSRCSLVEFSIPPKEKPTIAGQFFRRVQNILDAENVEYDKKVVVEVITKYFPDFRRILNELQRYSISGPIDSGILAAFKESSISGLIEMMRDKNLTGVRTWVAENSDFDSNDLYRMFYDQSAQYFEMKYLPILIPLIAKYSYQDAFVADRSINTAAFLVEVMVSGIFK